MFWLSQQPVTCSVSLSLRRTEMPLQDAAAEDAISQDAGAQDARPLGPVVQDTVVEDALWRQIGKVHYVSYLEPGEDGDARGDRITLKLEPQRLTLVRQGAIRWTSVFSEGLTHRSAMVLPGGLLPLETTTGALAIHIRPTGGEVLLEYQLLLGNWRQQVALQIHFTRNGQKQEV